jgi:hypothetical protein
MRFSARMERSTRNEIAIRVESECEKKSVLERFDRVEEERTKRRWQSTSGVYQLR